MARMIWSAVWSATLLDRFFRRNCHRHASRSQFLQLDLAQIGYINGLSLTDRLVELVDGEAFLWLVSRPRVGVDYVVEIFVEIVGQH